LADRSHYLGFAAAAALLLAAHVVSSRDNTAVSKHAVLPADDQSWHAGPEGMPAGVKFAAITGDPAQPGPFVLRAELPAGYSIAPYRRSADESIVVLAGALKIGDGARSILRRCATSVRVRSSDCARMSRTTPPATAARPCRSWARARSLSSTLDFENLLERELGLVRDDAQQLVRG